MANVNYWNLPLSGRKTQIGIGQTDVSICSITNACPVGRVAIFCNDVIYTKRGLILNIGQDAIDALREGLLDHSKIYTQMSAANAYYSSAKFNNPKPLQMAQVVIAPNSTLINTLDPTFQVGIIANQLSPRTTGLAYTALERIRDYIQENA